MNAQTETTPQPLTEPQRILQSLIHSNRRVRLFYGHADEASVFATWKNDPTRRIHPDATPAQIGKSWLDEWGMIGTIGQSMGPHKIPLLLHRRNSFGGGAILEDCIIAISCAPGAYLYRHPLLDLGDWTVGEPSEASRADGYVEAAYCNGELHAQFKKPGQAARYVAYMKNERWSK